MNADDAQIGFISIRKGYRAIVDRRITFRGFEGSPRRTLKESIRRAQGLSMVLIKNSYLALFGPRKNARMAIFNALFLYVIFPWVAFLFTINSVVHSRSTPELEQLGIRLDFCNFTDSNSRQGSSWAGGY